MTDAGPKISLAPEIPAWERQPEESPKKHGEFITYRDLGRTRTLVEAATRLDFHPVSVRRMGARYRWVERAEAWDRHLDQQYEAAWVERRRKAAETDAKVLDAAIAKLAQRLPTLKPDRLSAGDFTRLLDVTMRHRRALFGDAITTVEVTGQGGNPISIQVEEFTSLPAEQRRQRLAELAATVTRRLAAVNDTDDED